MKPSGWLHPLRPRSLSRSGGFVALTMASLVAHGMVLGLPWPETDPPPELPAPESMATGVMDVAILPSASTESPEPEASRRDRSTPEARPAAEPSPEPTEPRSPQSVPSADPARSPRPTESPPPVPRADPPPEIPPKADLPPLPEDDPERDPLADVPIAEGTETSPSEPPEPPTLAEQLQDAAAYQYDGRKTLKPTDAYQASTNWAVAGQVLPENVDPIELPYQLGETCLDTPPESGLLAVVLDAAGNPVQGPEVIDSTGYALLDEQAIAVVAEHPFPERSEPRGYVAEIVVNYPPACQ